MPCFPDYIHNKTYSYWTYWSGFYKKKILLHELNERTILKNSSGCYNVLHKVVGLYGEIYRPYQYNVNNTKEYKNKWVSENYCTPWINIWRLRRPWNKPTFIKMTWFGVKWLKKGWYAVKQNNLQIYLPLGQIEILVIFYTWNWAIGLMTRVFANGLGDQDSIPGQVIPKT